MTKEELIHKYLEHRELQAYCATSRYESIGAGYFISAMDYQFEMHYHQDEMEVVVSCIYAIEGELDLLQARWV